MLNSAFQCHKCGQTPHEAGKRGAYMSRATPREVHPAQFVCTPSCCGNHGDLESAGQAALEHVRQHADCTVYVPAGVPVGAHEEETE